MASQQFENVVLSWPASTYRFALQELGQRLWGRDSNAAGHLGDPGESKGSIISLAESDQSVMRMVCRDHAPLVRARSRQSAQSARLIWPP
jgi:hypothetical protein